MLSQPVSRGCPCRPGQYWCCRRRHSPSPWLCSRSTLSRLWHPDRASSSCPTDSALYGSQPQRGSTTLQALSPEQQQAAGRGRAALVHAARHFLEGAGRCGRPPPAGVAGQVAQGGALQRQGAQVVASVQVQAGQPRQAQGQAAQAGEPQPQRFEPCVRPRSAAARRLPGAGSLACNHRRLMTGPAVPAGSPPSAQGAAARHAEAAPRLPGTSAQVARRSRQQLCRRLQPAALPALPQPQLGTGPGPASRCAGPGCAWR